MRRRIAVVTTLALALSLGVPQGAVPEQGGFPLPSLASWFRQLPAWAAVTGVPVQKSAGGAKNRDHYVSAEQTRADGGQGRAPGRGRGAVDAEVPAPDPKKPWTTPVLSGENSFNEQTSKRVPQRSSARYDEFQNADGSFTRRLYGARVNFKDKSGTYQPIDTQLTRRDGRWAMRANSIAVDLAPRGAADASDPLASVTTASGHSLAYGLAGAAEVPAIVDGSTATYPEILPYTDVELDTFGDGLKETLILKSPMAGNQWVFPLRLKGLTPQLRADGSIALLNASGDVALRVPQGYMEDSNVHPRSGAPAQSSAVAYELITVDGQPALRVTADAAWLADPARRYPVRVDPSTWDTIDTGDVFVDNDSSTTNHNTNDLPVGTWNNGTSVSRSFIHFDEFDNDGLVGTQIRAAKLFLYHTWSWSCGDNTPFFVRQIHEPWTVDSLTNNAGLAAGPTFGTAIGTLTITNNSPACGNTSGDRSVGRWWSVPLAVTTFNAWSTRDIGNNGLAITASETSSAGFKRFTSANYGAAYKPYLQLTYDYNEYPQVNEQYPGYGQATQTLTPELLADAHDPDKFPKSLQYKFIVYGSDGKTQVATSNWLTKKSWIVPSGVLSWGESYYWTVQVSDGLLTNADALTKHLLVTPVPQPSITSGLSQNSGRGFDPSIGNYTTATRDAMVNTVGPPLEIVRSYNSIDPRSGHAFGAGWSTMADAHAIERYASGTTTVNTVVVTYPNGRQMAFGRNGNGTFSSPAGRTTTLSTVTGGYKLVEKDGTSYEFLSSQGSGRYAVTKVKDVSGRALTFTYTSGRMTKMTAASGRTLTLNWATPPGASAPHVASVSSDPVTVNGQTTQNTWTYSYSGDALTQACPPTSSTQCHTYGYTGGSLYQTAVSNALPHSYWRLTETSGTTAASSVLENAGADNGVYSNVTLGQPGPLAASTATAAGFNGSSSRVSVPAKLVGDASAQAISMWVKTSGGDGVLYGQSWEPATASAAKGAYNPTLYIGSNGKLVGGFPTAPTPGTAIGSLLAYGQGQCLEVPGNSSASNVVLALGPCTGAANQQWTWTADRELRVTSGGSVKCAGVSGGATGNGADLVTWACTGAVDQKWDVRANGQIINDNSYKCLDSVGDGTQNGAEMQIWACGRFNQADQSFVARTHNPMQSPATVADNQWHHVVLSASGNKQQMFVDGVQVAQQTGIAVQDMSPVYSYVGTGFLGGGWPNQSRGSTVSNLGTADYFTGSVAEVALFDTPVTEQMVGDIYRARTPVTPLTEVRRPSGNATAQVSYDGVTGRVSQMTDGNGGVWRPLPASVAGTTKIYESAVLGGVPSNYWRLAETGTVDAVNEINGDIASYSSVTLGSAPGPFGSSAPAASFNGTSSYLSLPGAEIPPATADDRSIGLWFKTSSSAGGVLAGFQTNALGQSGDAQWLPALYVGVDGKLRGTFCYCNGAGAMTSTTTVNDGKWHSAVLTRTATGQALYLDGKQIATKTTTSTETRTLGYGYIGAGKISTHWPSTPTNLNGHFNGQIAEVAFYRSSLDTKHVETQFKARDAVKAAAVPGVTYTVVHPDDAQSKDVHDLQAGRKVAEVDTRGFATRFGYSSKGYLRTVTDPNGNMTINEHDVRGNVVSTTTCQDRSANKCSTSYSTYYPDATTQSPPANVLNDRLLEKREAGSTSASDNTYLTTYTYDPVTGNRTATTDPLGRRTTVVYTDGTTVAAFGGGFAPPGLPSTITKPGGGVVRIVYYTNGDIAEVTDPAGLVTRYEYDQLGRTTKEIDIVGGVPRSTTAFKHDALDRVVERTDPATTNQVTGATHTPVTTVTYNEDGLPVSETVSDSTGGDAPRTVTYGYDSHGRRVTETDAKGKTLTLGYDPYGRVHRQTHADGSILRTDYDAIGNELAVVVENYTGDPNDPSPPTDLIVKSMAYDPAGRLASVTDAMGWRTEYTYTDNNLLATVTRSDPSTGASFTQENNSYDAAGNLVSQITNNGLTRTDRTYDSAGRGLTATLNPGGLNRTTTHTYSANDDVLSTTLTQGGTLVGASEALYDPLGRVLSNTTYTGNAATPVGRWMLDETTGGKAADSTGNNAGMLPASGVGWSTDHGGSAQFDGTSAIETAGPAVDATAGFTVAAWVYLTDGTAKHKVVAARGVMQDAFSLGFDDATVEWRFNMKDSDTTSSPGKAAKTSAAGQLNTWTHLVGTYDPASGTMSLYVNGVLKHTATATTTFTPRKSMLIGAGTWNGALENFWQGRVDDVQVYSRPLSGSEVGQVRSGALPAADARVIRTSYTLDTDGSITSTTNPNGDTTYVTNDEVGRAVVTTSPAASTVAGEQAPVTAVSTVRLGYNTFDELTEQQDPNGNVTVVRYDAAGQPVETQLPAYTPPGSSTPIVAKTTNVYNAVGQVVSTSDPLGAETSIVYDQLGRTAKVTAPDGGVSRFEYNLNGDLLSQTDPTGAKGTATYDYLGRTVTSTEVVRQTGKAHTTTFGYGTGPWPTSITSPTGVVTTQSYNTAGEQISVTDGASNTTTTQYDGAGRPIRVTAPDQTYQTMAYDLAGRAINAKSYSPGPTNAAADDVLLRTVSSQYDAAGNLVAATDARGTTKTFAFDALGQMVSQTEPISGSDQIVSTFGYDLAGRQTRFTDGRGNRFITTYNPWGLVESQIEPATTAHPALADRTFTMSYDAAGQLVRLDSPGGVSVTSEYDDLGRLVRSSGAGAQATTVDRTFGYDAAGRMTSFVGSAGETTVEYDDRSLPVTIGGVSGASSYSYNGDGALASRTDAAGTTSYTYDTAGRPATVVNPTAGTNLTYGYNTMSQVSSITHGTGGNVRSFSYDELHRMTADELKTSGGTSIAKIQYGWDLNDNVTSKTTIGLTGAAVNTYTYDLADRLIGWNNGTNPVVYAYDKSGNRVQAGSKTFTYDARNQVQSSSDGTSYEYTPRGTLARTRSGGQDTATVTDAFNQVWSQGSAGGAASTYTYDGLGRLIQPNLTYTGLGNTVAGDGGAVYVRDAADGLVGVASGGTQRYAWTDLHTDVVGEFTGTGTTLTASVAYDPWGKVLSSTGMLGKLGYQSQWTDQGTGRVNMWARWYNPETGAFDTRDDVTLNPTPSSGAANRFAYAEADPLGNTDTTGHAVDGKCGQYDYACELKKYDAAIAQYTRDLTQHQRDVKFAGEGIARQEADYQRAERESQTSLFDILLQVGVGMLLDMIGWTSLMGCLDGGVWDCIDLATNFLGPIKV
ncbi:LamG-like jellyroll fold domain-containing protein, partial [Micromonospora marina]|uniref:LamG-like jellyroll fold domain-containing protein n=1 Tax=Micromonospora marina TaxID=307120 RepID=UPI003D72720E